MNKILISLFFGILFISLASAASTSDFPPHQQFTDYDLTISSNNGTSCTWTYLQYSNGSQIIHNLGLTKSGTTFSTTVHSNNYSDLGETTHGVSCTDGVSFETGSKTINVTPDGLMDTIGFFFLVLILSLGIMILGFSLRDAIIVTLGTFGFYFLGLRVLFYGLDGVKDPVYTWAIGIIILAVAFYISTKSTYEMIVD